MDMYGRIPLVTSYNEMQDDVRQSERSEVLRFIVNELQEVVASLPDEHSNMMGNHYGRITAPVVHFLLAKLTLNAEIYCDDDWTDSIRPNGRELFFQVDGEKLNAWEAPVVHFLLAKLTLNAEIYCDDDWTDSIRPNGRELFFQVDGEKLNAWEACIRYCDKLAESGYVLEKDYSYNFAVHNENSSENIFTIPLDKNFYAAQFHYLFRSRHYNHGGALGGASENGTSATVSTVLSYGYGTDHVDARFEKNFYAGQVVVDGKIVKLDSGEPLEYKPLELKLNLTGSRYVKTAGARMAKYEVDRTSYSDGRQPDNDIVLFRYADVLLMKAEAKVRNGEDGSLELNQVRSRVGMPDRNATLENILEERLLELVWEGWRRQDLIRFEDGSLELNQVRSRVGMPDRNATLENILEERLLELVWEGWRRQDLIRFGRFHQSYDQRKQLTDEANGYTTVFPIPQKCIDLNPRLEQHVGYK